MKADSVSPADAEPRDVEGQPGRRRSRPHHRRDGEDDQHGHLEAHEHELHPLGGRDAPVGHRRRDGDEDQAREDRDGLVLPQVAHRIASDDVADELVEELHRHPGQVRQDDDRREQCGPAAEPTHIRPECLGRPGEGRAAVGGHPVELPVGIGREEHREEAGDEDHRHLKTGFGRHQSQRRGEGVGRCDAGDAEHHAAEQTHRVLRETLVRRVRLSVLARLVRLDLHADLAVTATGDRNPGVGRCGDAGGTLARCGSGGGAGDDDRELAAAAAQPVVVLARTGAAPHAAGVPRSR